MKKLFLPSYIILSIYAAMSSFATDQYGDEHNQQDEIIFISSSSNFHPLAKKNKSTKAHKKTKSSRKKRGRSEFSENNNTPPKKKKGNKPQSPTKKKNQTKILSNKFYGDSLSKAPLPDITAFFADDEIRKNMPYFAKLMMEKPMWQNKENLCNLYNCVHGTNYKITEDDAKS